MNAKKASDSPPFKMIVEDGRLVPAAAWDQERLLTYRNRSTVSVRITQDKNRKLERKYWAILHQVVAKCAINQRTAEDLHKAIRLKLGIVDAFWTIDGRLRVEIKSTSGMDDPEYSAFYEEAMALLEEVTGVDPETLSAESADVGEDEEQDPPEDPVPSDGEGSGGSPPPPAPAATADHIPAVGDPRAFDQIATFEKKLECMDKFLAAAADQTLPDAKQRQKTIIGAKDVWKDALPNDHAFVKACVDTANKVVKGQLSAPVARHYLEGLLS